MRDTSIERERTERRMSIRIGLQDWWKEAE